MYIYRWTKELYILQFTFTLHSHTYIYTICLFLTHSITHSLTHSLSLSLNLNSQFWFFLDCLVSFFIRVLLSRQGQHLQRRLHPHVESSAKYFLNIKYLANIFDDMGLGVKGHASKAPAFYGIYEYLV